MRHDVSAKIETKWLKDMLNVIFVYPRWRDVGCFVSVVGHIVSLCLSVMG